jgi:N-acetylmuramoyl-L-alanine amidase
MKKKKANRIAAIFVLFAIAIIINVFIFAKPSGSQTTVMHGTGRHSGEIIRYVAVVVDPGHGGEDQGASSGGLNEKDINLDVSLKIRDLLLKNGINVKLTRDKDIYVGLKERADMANDLGADLFISVHTNSLPQHPSLSGIETLYAPEQPMINGIDSKKFAGMIQGGLIKKLGSTNNGIKSRPELAVLHRTQMPAVIAEMGYISNVMERENLKKPNFRKSVAEALATTTIETLKKMDAYKDGENKWVIPSKDSIKK